MRVTLLFFVLISTSSYSQRPIGTWKAHFPYAFATKVQESEDKIYVASQLSIFYINKSDFSIQSIDKASGLSDVDVADIVYNTPTKTLVIAYKNSNIDLFVNDEFIYNLPEIKNKITTSSKNINNLYSFGKNVFISSDLGVSVLDLERKEIRSTYVIGQNGASVPVQAFTASQTQYFASTNEGIKIANINGSNLQNFGSWTLQNNGIPAKRSNQIASLGNQIYTQIGDTIYRYNGSNWSSYYADTAWSIERLKTTNQSLWIALWKKNSFETKWLVVDQNGDTTSKRFTQPNRNIDVVASDKIWVADLWTGLWKYNTDGSGGERFAPDGPITNGGFNLAFFENTAFLASGGVDPSYISGNNNRDGVVLYENELWRFYNFTNGYPLLFDCKDIITVSVSEPNKKVYYGSFGGGLVEYDIESKNISIFNNSNSPLEAVSGIATLVSALTTDKKGNVWMMNSGASQPLKIYDTKGNWISISVPYSIRSTRKMLIDSRGWLWMCQRDGDVIVYDSGDDLESMADDKFVRLGTGNGLPSNSVWTIVEDKDNDIWVGTDEGVGTFFCASSVFSNNGCNADKIKVERDGFIGFLFSTEVVKALAVDAGNRKWVGTLNGVYLITKDGKNELLNFTDKNSPLPSNSILDIKINPKTGEVFIATEQGLVSYQGDAIQGEEKKGEAIAYPNPVLPNYDGPIAIKGLVDDAYVKILDASGVLVYQGKAFGGQMIWDGKGYEGKRVASGVYLVYAATDAGKERNVAKIVLLN